jgi:hypothetical protein
MTRLHRRQWLQWAAASAAACMLPLRAQTSQGVGALDLDWADTRRQRDVPVRLYLPHQGAALAAGGVFARHWRLAAWVSLAG